MLDRPCVIIGNGPSAAGHGVASLPDAPVIFRMNWFFLEPQPAFGAVVHGHFRSIYNPALEAGLDHPRRSGAYDIRTFFAPMRAGARDHAPHQALAPELDHWSTICRAPRLAQLLSRRPLPTQGLQALGFAAACGFRDIRTIGVDLYDDGRKRYAFDVPGALHAHVAAKDLEPGYEANHSLAADAAFLGAVLDAFPDIRLTAIAASERMASLVGSLTARRASRASTPPAVWSHPSLARFLVSRPRPSLVLRDAAATLADGASQVDVPADAVFRITPEKPGARRLAPPAGSKAGAREQLDLDVQFLAAVHHALPDAEVRFLGLSETDARAVARVTRPVAPAPSRAHEHRRCAFVTFASGAYAI